MSEMTPERVAEMEIQMKMQRIPPPRTRLQIQFVNRGKTTMEISVVELKSLLGDFAVRPERIALAPGQSGAIEPVHSNYSGNFTLLEVGLSLRRGDEIESKTLQLAPLKANVAP